MMYSMLGASLHQSQSGPCEHKALRSGDGNQEWITSQVGHDQYFAHVNEFARCFSDPAKLAQMGYAIDPAGMRTRVAGEVITEDDFSDMQYLFNMSLISNRCRRGLWMTAGWPTRLTKLQVGGNVARAAWTEFDGDVKIFKRFDEYEPSQPSIKRVKDRHLFRLVVNKQMMKALEELGPDYDEATHTDLLQLITRRSRLPWGTQVCEDTIGSMKNQRRAKTRLYRKPETCLANAIKGRVLDARHKYSTVVLDRPLTKKTERLPKSCWQATKKTRSLPFEQIATTTSGTSWYSPSASNHMCPVADLQLLRACASADGDDDRFGEMGTAWLGSMWSVKHHFGFRRKGGGADDLWYIALDHFADSVVHGWPCHLRPIPCYEDKKFFELAESADGAKPFAILDLDDWEACSFEVWSYLHQWVSFPIARGLLRLAIRMVVDVGPTSVQEIAARSAFWDMGASFLTDLSSHLGFSSSSSSVGGMFPLLFGLCQNILGESDETILTIVQRRLAVHDIDLSYADGVLCLDEAVEILDRSDHEKVKQEQTSVKSRSKERESFAAEYVRKKRQVVAAAKKESNQKKKKMRLTEERVLVPSVIPQATVKHLAPPGASVWVGHTHETWNGHMRPRRRISAPWRDFADGEQGALRDVLRRLWGQYCEIEGEDFDELVKFA